MKLEISASLNYRLPEPVDLMLQIEAADGHGQRVLDASLDLGNPDHLARVPTPNGICEPIWLREHGQLRVDYRAQVAIDRPAPDLASLAAVPLHRLPAGAVPYLNESRYCPSNKFHAFVERRGVCRDYAHVMIALARAAHIPARMASAYALGVEPQDFHAVAEIYLAGDWHPVDATGMARGDATSPF
jgi:hypothetical protein